SVAVSLLVSVDHRVRGRSPQRDEAPSRSGKIRLSTRRAALVDSIPKHVRLPKLSPDEDSGPAWDRNYIPFRRHPKPHGPASCVAPVINYSPGLTKPHALDQRNPMPSVVGRDVDRMSVLQRHQRSAHGYPVPTRCRDERRSGKCKRIAVAVECDSLAIPGLVARAIDAVLRDQQQLLIPIRVPEESRPPSRRIVGILQALSAGAIRHVRTEVNTLGGAHLACDGPLSPGHIYIATRNEPISSDDGVDDAKRPRNIGAASNQQECVCVCGKIIPRDEYTGQAPPTIDNRPSDTAKYIVGYHDVLDVRVRADIRRAIRRNRRSKLDDRRRVAG